MKVSLSMRALRAYLLPLCAVALGLFLLLLPTSGDAAKGEYPDYPKTISDIPAYEDYLSHKIAQMTNQMLHTDDTSAYVTLNGPLGAEDRSSYFGTGKEDSVAELPQIRGVAVICKGGGDAKIRLEIISMVTAVFDIPTQCVYVGEKNTITQ